MLSLTFFPPQITPFRHFHPLDSQPFQSPYLRTNSKAKLTSKTQTKIPRFSSDSRHVHLKNEDSSSTSSTSNENPEADSTDFPKTPWYVDSDALASRLKSCRNLKDVKRLHTVVLKCLKIPKTCVGNTLITVYLKFGDLMEARKVFDKMLERNVVSWSDMVSGYFRFGKDDEALRLYTRSVEYGFQANEKMFVCVLNLCSKRSDYDLGRQVHGRIVKGNRRNMIVDSAIVYFYSKSGELASAFNVFDSMGERDVVCWTTMITACAQHGRVDKVFALFSRMLNDNHSPNEFTTCSVLKACSEGKELRFGRQLHCAVVKKVFKNDVFVETSLVDMYAKCEEIVDSRNVFDRMKYRNTVTWTSIIAGYARKELGEEAIRLFRVMKKRNVNANSLTIVSILRACGSITDLSKGREVHTQIVKNSIGENIYMGSTLVWMYCKCREYRTASRVLQRMPLRDVVSWTAMISGCARLGHELEALEFLKEMMEEGVEPNSFTYSSSLKACANLKTVSHGKSIHSFANKTPSLSNVFVGSALVHMYARCGFVSEAFRVFESMPERNLVSWKAMIVGYARNGYCQEALKLMYKMQDEGVEVDDYIVSTVLCACGDVELGVKPLSEYRLTSSYDSGR